MTTPIRNEANRNASRRRRGAGLLEMFMYLVLAAIVGTTALLYYQSASTSQKTTAAASELGSVAASVRNVYSGQPNYTGLTNVQIRGSLPNRMSLGTDGIQHAFQGPITVAPAAGGNGGAAGAAFTVTFAGLPTEACKSLATKDFGRAVNALTINGAAQPGVVATPANSETACSAGNNNSIAWTLF